MTTAAEITAQIDTLESNPRYSLLLTSSRGPFENREFQQYQLQLSTLRLRRDDLTKREQINSPPAPKPASALVLPTEKKRMDVLTQPNKAIPDPPEARKPIFNPKMRSAHLQAPSGPKVHGVTGAPQQNLVVVPASNVLPPPADTSMQAARRGPHYAMPAAPTPSTNSSITAEDGKLTRTPNTLAPIGGGPVVKSPPAGRVAPSGRGDGELEAPAVVGKPKGLTTVAIVETRVTDRQMAEKVTKIEDPERAAARKALTTEVETVDYLDNMDLHIIDDDGSGDNIVNDLAAIDDMDDLSLESEPAPAPVEPVTVPVVTKKAGTGKKTTGKSPAKSPARVSPAKSPAKK